MEWFLLFLLAVLLTGWEIHRRRIVAPLRLQVAQLQAEKRRLDEKLEAEKVNLEAIVASMEEGLLVVDQQHVVQHANSSFRRLFQIPDDPVGRTVLETVREAQIERLVSDALVARNAQKLEFPVMRPGVKPLWLAVNSVPIQEADAVVLVFHDVTNLREVEEMRTKFVANVSHELRTPLSIFQGYVETLLDLPDLGESERREILEIMARHSKRLNTIVDDLLTIARLEGGATKLEQVDIELLPFLRAIERDWQKRADEKQIKLRLQVEPENIQTHADRTRLEQVLTNLLENAFKYTPEGGAVTIVARTEGNRASISVEDTGVGIPPADLPHIFERFYRVEKSRSREDGGTGLGLSIAKHIVLLHGGAIAAESTYGQGTRITARFPAAAQP